MSHTTLDLAIKKLLVGSLALTAAALTACQDSTSPVDPATDIRTARSGTGKPGAAQTVLFAGYKDAQVNYDIYAMNPDGSNVRRLTTDTTKDVFPDFAPDNRKFVWVRSLDGIRSELFTANYDGSKPTQLTRMGADVFEPRYSPDGTKIVFAAAVREQTDNGFTVNYDIYVINVDGSGLTRLTYEKADDRAPAWSPNGQTIAFHSDRSGFNAIYRMNAGGLDVHLMVDCGTAGCVDPAFSPEGRRLAYADRTDNVIRVIDLDGENLPMAVGPATERLNRRPTWTKDGGKVVFASNRGIEETKELYVGTPGQTDIASVQRLTVFSPGEAEMPSYSH
jgi:TolB protein